jgi:ATP-dependent Lon protease
MAEKQPAPEVSSENIPEFLPILPLFDTALYPKMVLPLVVMQPESIQLIDEAMSKERIVGLVVAKQQVQETPFPKEELSAVGTSA